MQIRHRGNVVALVILASVFFSDQVLAVDFLSCNDCHAETLEFEQSKDFLHSPFAQQKCVGCHAFADSNTAQEQNVRSSAERNKITWLAESAIKDINHAFLLPYEKVGKTLVIELHGEAGQHLRREISTPFLNNLELIEDSAKSLVISNVRIVEIKHDISLKVTVGWQTNYLASSKVLYGLDDLDQKASQGERFGLNHEVVLYNLKPDRNYNFEVVSQDLFGRGQTSERITFSTSSSSASDLPATPKASTKKFDDMSLKSFFHRLNKNYLIEFSLELPATAYIGSKGSPRTVILSGKRTVDLKSTFKAHAELSSEAVISLRACRNCHKDQSTATHPVNVYPKPGMTIPPEYPTLPDGRISCNSCHDSHSSNFDYLSRKDGKRELCIGCHKDMI